MSIVAITPSSFSEAVAFLELDFFVTYCRDHPEQLVQKLSERIAFAAKLLSRTTRFQHSKALEAVAQATRFASWHGLSAHLAHATGAEAATLSDSWFDALSGALLLLAHAQPDIALPEAQVHAFERFGQTLSMLTDSATQDVLDTVCAGLCAGKTWDEVRSRTPLKSKTALYQFIADDGGSHEDGDDRDDDDEGGGYFEPSAACLALIEELDEQWQGYARFSKPQKRKARRWVEDALAAQPGFLEAGLAMATMQHDAGEAEASATLNRFIKQAEALIPTGFKGRIDWAPLGNRHYHRMSWLRFEMDREAKNLKSAVRMARRLLRLNPPDNMGVRYVLPLILLQQGEHAAAKRATHGLAGEEGMTAATVRAFCEYAVGNQALFRRELARALISLPWLRTFLLNQRTPLPDGDEGFRGFHPDTELLYEFAWPVYISLPGLMDACRRILAEPLVQQVEAELRRYWKGFWVQGDDGVGSMQEWGVLCHDAEEEIMGSRIAP